jgi:hypothetical protein
MAEFSLEIKGVDDLLRKLGTIEKVQDKLQPVAQREIRRVRERAQVYPPMLPNQRYVRTFKLRRGWADNVERVQSGLVARATNRNVPYNIYVQGHGTQAGIHRNRWETNKQILERETPAIVRAFDDEITKALKA